MHALAVPIALGFSPGKPNAPAVQRRILEDLLARSARNVEALHVAPYVP